MKFTIAVPWWIKELSRQASPEAHLRDSAVNAERITWSVWYFDLAVTDRIVVRVSKQYGSVHNGTTRDYRPHVLENWIHNCVLATICGTICLGSTVWCSVTSWMSYPTMNITFRAHFARRTFFRQGEPVCLQSFDWRFKFVSYERAQFPSIATIRPRKSSPCLWYR